MKLVILSSLIAASSAFTTSSVVGRPSLRIQSTENEQVSEVAVTPDEEVAPPAPVVNPINGWVPDDSPCYGLPGALAPTGFFDPLGFARKGISLNEVKRNREAEVMHGRVAMIASVGYLAGESTSGPFNIVGPANDQLQQMPAPVFALLTAAIAAAELNRARIGWVEPDLGSWTKTLWKLRDNYYPGDIGFDPLGLKPTDAQAYANMQTRELQNGRLAMLGVAGMCAQELVNHRTIIETLDFYSKVYSGENPYALCGYETIC
jgi:hypothetical protein